MKMAPGVTLNQSVDERIKEFRSDPLKMDITTKFVNDVVEEAKDEVMKRMKERDRIEAMNSGSDRERKRGRWHSRARGFFSRLFASLCLCNPETKV